MGNEKRKGTKILKEKILSPLHNIRLLDIANCNHIPFCFPPPPASFLMYILRFIQSNDLFSSFNLQIDTAIIGRVPFLSLSPHHRVTKCFETENTANVLSQ
jgi:hypothetical protein